MQQRFVDLARSAAAGGAARTAQNLQKQFPVMQLISAYRFQGNRVADIDPLKRIIETPPIAELDPAHYGLTEADMDTVFDTGTLHGPAKAPLRDILQALRDTYCRSIGVEYMYMSDIPQKRWMSERLEPSRGRPNYDAAYKKHLLDRLTAAETLEKYLNAKYVGQTRFSLEGGDGLIPMLDHLLQRAGNQRRAGNGDRHGAPRPAQCAGQHAGQDAARTCSRRSRASSSADVLAGDVKYHDGFSSNVMTPGGPDARHGRVQSVAPRDRQSGG